MFGNNAASDVVVNGAGTEITAKAPAGFAGKVDVIVYATAGSSTAVKADKYQYTRPPR